MSSTYHAFAALLQPFGGTEGLIRTYLSSALAYGIGLFILELFFWRNGKLS